MTDIIAIGAILLVVGLALTYIIRAKKRGVKCVGCPHAESCPSSGKSNGGCDCKSKE